jgi:hypothetical protein
MVVQAKHACDADRIGGIYWKDASKFEPDLAALQNFSLAPVSLPGGCRTVMSR